MKNCEILRFIYKNSSLTYEKLSKITEVKENTLANWITLRRNPPTYVVCAIYDKVKKYLAKDKREEAEKLITDMRLKENL